MEGHISVAVVSPGCGPNFPVNVSDSALVSAHASWHLPGPYIPRSRDQQGISNPQNLTPRTPQRRSPGHHLSGTATPPTQITLISHTTPPQLHLRWWNRPRSLRIWKCHWCRDERNSIHFPPMSYDSLQPKDPGWRPPASLRP